MNEPKSSIESSRAKAVRRLRRYREYFNIDANLVRLIWVVLSLLTVVVTGVVLSHCRAVLCPRRATYIRLLASAQRDAPRFGDASLLSKEFF